jgi:hypothetical protein
MKRGGDFDFDSAQLNAWVENAAASGRFGSKTAESLQENPIFYVLIGRLARRGVRLDGESRLAPFEEDLFQELILETTIQPQEAVTAIGAYLRLQARDFGEGAKKTFAFRSSARERLIWAFWMVVFASPAFFCWIALFSKKRFDSQQETILLLSPYLIFGAMLCLLWASRVGRERMALSYLRQVRPILAAKRSFASGSLHGVDSIALGCAEIVFASLYCGVAVGIGCLVGNILCSWEPFVGWSAGALLSVYLFVESFNAQLKRDSKIEQKFLKEIIAAWRKEDRPLRAQSA